MRNITGREQIPPIYLASMEAGWVTDDPISFDDRFMERWGGV
jgi:hypothetical protein